MMRKLILIFLSCAILSLKAQETDQVNFFRLQEVRLLPGAFYDAQTTDLNYILALDPDRLLAPYLREAGLHPKAVSYTNWENTGLDGHIGGHYLSALSLMYASTGDKRIFERLDYMIRELKKCQDSGRTGYLGGVPGSKDLWEEVKQGKLEVSGFSVNKKWVPLYNIHKMYAGLRDAYWFGGIEAAKDMLIKFTDWMINTTAGLSDEQIQNLLRSEHGGLNVVFADVYQITGDKKYLALAYRFSHQFILNPLSNKEDKLNNLHANTQIPKIIGFEKIAELTGDSAYKTASEFFWETVVDHRTVAIGGNSVREHFHPVNDFSSMISSEQGPETCNTYNMLRLTKMLFGNKGEEKYIEYYERALYNHILSSQHPRKGGFVYFTPMRPGHYRVYSQPQTSMWCCVGSGLENHAKYGELIYAYSNSDLFVNLFIPSRLNWVEKGNIISQTTNFPEEGRTSIKFEKVKNDAFTLQVRHPKWIAPGELKIKVNGKFIHINSQPGSFEAISRKWKTGDIVEVFLPMRISVEPLPDHSEYSALLYGPIVLASKTDTTDLKGLFADDSRMGHVAQGKQIPLQKMPFLVNNDRDISPKVKAINKSKLTFSVSDIIYPAKFKSLELIPFYKLHDSRYIIYWPIVTPEKLKSIEQKIALEDEERQKLAAQTVDMVYCGEQQPESDHFIESENSATGVTNDRHWRSARGWFSYKMSDQNKKTAKVLISYFGMNNDQGLILEVNGVEIGKINAGEPAGQVLSREFTIPENVSEGSNGIIILKFKAMEGKNTGRVVEVRLLKDL